MHAFFGMRIDCAGCEHSIRSPRKGTQLHRRRKWLAEGLGYLESAALAAEVPAARPEA